MSRRSASIKIATKAGILFGALFLVTVLIAAIPAHQQRALEVVIAPEPSVQDSAAQSQSSSQSADHASMPGMKDPVVVGFDVTVLAGARIRSVLGFLDSSPAA